VLNKRDEERLVSARCTDALFGACGKDRNVRRGKIGKFDAFEMIPTVFHGIEFRRIGREEEYLETSMMLHGELPDQPSAMDIETIPHDKDGPSNGLEELAKEFTTCGSFNVLLAMDAEVSAGAGSAPRLRANRANHADLGIGSSTLEHQGRLSTGRPCAAHQRRHQDARFVDEGDGRLRLLGFFLIEGHWWLTH